MNIVETINKKIKHNNNYFQAQKEEESVRNMERTAKIMSKSINEKYLKNSKNPKYSWLVSQLKKIIHTEEKAPSKHSFIFENTREAAKFNTKIIKWADYDYIQAIQKQPNTILHPGTEFRNIAHLTQLLQFHDDWDDIKDIITKGCDYKLEEEVDDETLKSDLTAMIKRGNHKSAKTADNIKALQKTFDKEISRGWMLPITVESIMKIKNISIIPLGMVDQWSIDSNGNRIPKKRVTHDASFPAPSGNSVNKRVIKSLLQDCIYGQALRRILHSLHNIRFHNPQSRIFMLKHDMDAAYRRLHTMPLHALKCVTILGKIGYIPLRLPFGVASGPSIYSTISECIFDLVNDLLMDPTWEPNDTHSTEIDTQITPEIFSSRDTLSPTKQLAVYIPYRSTFCDGYIDDGFTAGIEGSQTLSKIQAALPLAANAIFRPTSTNEPILRDMTISQRKLQGEGTPSERKVMLGWLLDTQLMRIFLTPDKTLAWSKDIQDILLREKTSFKEMESMIGRLNHVGYILPNSRYFLNRLRHLTYRCERFGTQTLKPWETQDFQLWLEILDSACNKGVHTNSICHTTINTYLITDACEFGLGGYNIKTGKAWRYQLPSWMTERFHINLLEFISCVIAIWLEIIGGTNTPHTRILALTDNSSAVGWLYKSNFNPQAQPGHDAVARKLARLLMDNETTIESQHISGKHNIIADSLSRDLHIKRSHLEFLIKQLFPSQIPQTFEISEELPPEITSWLASLKALQTKQKELHPVHSPSNLGALIGTDASLQELASLTSSLTDSAKQRRSPSCRLLQAVSDEITLVKEMEINSLAAQSHPPCATYARPFGRTFGTTRL